MRVWTAANFRVTTETPQPPISSSSPLGIHEMYAGCGIFQFAKQSLELNKAELRACDLTSREVTVYISVKEAKR